MEKAERAAERKVAKKRKLKESKTREEAAKKGGLWPSTEPLMAFAPVISLNRWRRNPLEGASTVGS